VEALAAIEASAPSVAVLDLRMPKLSGIEVARLAPESTAALLYTAHADRGLLVEAVDAGARGYVLKEAPLDDLVRAVETVAAGGTYVDPVLAGELATAAASSAMPMLTRREREVLRLLADGCSNEDVARRLGISPETVRTHVRKLMRKLDAQTRTQAVATALRLAIIA
jgi:DNA-binding NarL/FixJ family response regulator